MSDSPTLERPALSTVTLPADAVMDAVAKLDAVDSFLSRLTGGTSRWQVFCDSLQETAGNLRRAAFGEGPDTDEAVATDPTRIELELRSADATAALYESVALHEEAALCREWAKLIRAEGHMANDIYSRSPWHGTSPEAELEVFAAER